MTAITWAVLHDGDLDGDVAPSAGPQRGGEAK